MKKFRFRKLIVIFGILLLTACTSMSKDVKELDGKIFNGFKGGQILVLEQKEGFSKKAKLLFSGAGVINPNTNPEDIKEDAYKKSLPQEFNNPKIIEKDGKKYLTADNFPYKLVIKDKKTIVDEEDKNEFIYVNLYDPVEENKK